MQMLTGVSPFEQLPQLQIAEAILAEPAPELDAQRFTTEAVSMVTGCLQHSLKARVALTDLMDCDWIDLAPSRKLGFMPLIKTVLERKNAIQEEEETARRRALVGGGSNGSKRTPSPANSSSSGGFLN